MPGSRPGESKGTKEALLDALQESVQDARAREEVVAEHRRRGLRKRSSPVIVASAVIAVLVAAWLLLARPDWVFPAGTPVQSVQQLEAGLRIGLFLEARQVHDFTSRTGRPPRTLEEAGVPSSGSAYTLQPDGRWSLEASQHGVRMRVNRDDDLSTFLRPSFTAIRGGRR